MNRVLSDYIEAAMAQAIYDKLQAGGYIGRISNFEGVLTLGESLLDCEGKLRSMIEEAILLSLQTGQRLPIIKNIDLHRDGSHRQRSSLQESPPNLRSLLQDSKDEIEREAIMLTLKRTKWNRKEAARQLRISYKSILNKIRKYDLDRR